MIISHRLTHTMFKEIMGVNDTLKDHISVCIPTFRRNRMLERLLRNLAMQETGGLFEYSIVIVDNDVMGSAKEIVIRFTYETDLNITYGIEPERSIPAVRNHALKLARGNYIGIIDDDEFPPQQWLLTLYRAIHAFDVDGALGPVYPYFDESPPAWLLKGKFCERPAHRTGTLLNWDQTRTGNVLLKKDVFEKHHLRFNENFKTGGSDREFFKQAMAAGCKFIAVEEAPVYEIVPPERWTKSYYVKRALINGFNSHRYGIGKKDGVSSMIMPLKSAFALIAYTILLPFCFLIGTHAVMKYLEKGAHHFSQLCATIGIELIKERNF